MDAPSRFNSNISFSANFLSQTMHCFEGCTSESVHVLHVTCPQGFITERKYNMRNADFGR